MTKQEGNKEKFLVRSLKNNDSDAFTILFEDYSHRLYQFAYKYLKSETEAEGIVQEVFVKVWLRRNDLDPESSFKSYLFTIAFNFIKKRFVKLAKENNYKDELIYSSLEISDNLEKLIDYRFLIEQVEKIIDTLPARRKEIFIKRKYQELSIKEIAEEMGISPNTVENQLASAKKYILEQLGKENLGVILFYILFLD